MVLSAKQPAWAGNETSSVVIQFGGPLVSDVLANLLHDTSAPILAMLVEKYGLRRIPGLSQDSLITRILQNLSPSDLARLENELIAARFGALSIDELLQLALEHDPRYRGRSGKPRLDRISPGEAILLEGGTRRWVYTMRGHDVMIDLEQRHLSCSCPFFEFAARGQALCKHLATAFTLIPVAYAREALVNILVWREYGDRHAPGWYFGGARKRAA